MYSSINRYTINCYDFLNRYSFFRDFYRPMNRYDVLGNIFWEKKFWAKIAILRHTCNVPIFACFFRNVNCHILPWNVTIYCNIFFRRVYFFETTIFYTV